MHFPAVVQTICFHRRDIAGPAEISYFAQSQVVYRHLLGRMRVLPRAGFTLVDAKARNF